MVRRKKSKLERELEQSIKLAKAAGFRKGQSLTEQLWRNDGLDIPDSLADPDEDYEPPELPDSLDDW